MLGNEKVLEQLNAALASELTAIAQYMAQSEMCQGWGYARLGDLTKARAIEEMKHAEGLIERIIFLDGTPAVNVALTPKLGTNPQTQLEIDLADEIDAVKEYNQAWDWHWSNGSWSCTRDESGSNPAVTGRARISCSPCPRRL